MGWLWLGEGRGKGDVAGEGGGGGGGGGLWLTESCVLEGFGAEFGCHGYTLMVR